MWASSNNIVRCSKGRIRASFPFGANKRQLSFKRSAKERVSVCRAVFRCLLGHFRESMKYGGFDMIRSYLMSAFGL